MRLIFMGTPDFAVPVLEALCQAGHQIALVVTQPDRPKGRSAQPVFSPVKTCALEHQIPVYQPEKLREQACVEKLRSVQADAVVVAAFGQILPPEILTLAPYGCLNVHASLLPAYRGAAPIQWALLNGEKTTGVTTMQMNEGLDTGDILLQKEVPISETETGGSLTMKLSEAGAALCVETLEALLDGTVQPKEQGESSTDYARMIKKEMGCIDWTQSACSIERMIRSFDPWPSAYTSFHGQHLKLWKAVVIAGDSRQKPGTVVAVQKDAFDVQTGAGLLRVLSLQMPGKKRMDTGAFLRGNDLTEGTNFADKE